MDDAELIALLTRPDLPAAFERWHVVIATGRAHPTRASAWAGALVLVAQGRVEVACHGGDRHTFADGAVVMLARLPLHTLRNAGARPVRLVAVRRR